jgi:hypothetical protein
MSDREWSDPDMNEREQVLYGALISAASEDLVARVRELMEQCGSEGFDSQHAAGAALSAVQLLTKTVVERTSATFERSSTDVLEVLFHSVKPEEGYARRMDGTIRPPRRVQ